MAKTTSPMTDERPVRMRATPARQGFLDRDILAVLLVSTALAMVVLFVALAIQSSAGHLDRQGGQTRVVEDTSGQFTTLPGKP